MDHSYQVNHSCALNPPKDGLPSTQSSNDALRQMGSEGKMGAVHEEMKRVSRLPPSSTYATHRMRVLNKILQLMSIQVHGAYIQWARGRLCSCLGYMVIVISFARVL